jgi:UDP-glucose 4-epimerase
MTNKKVLVTGGCGYIGSHTIVDLVNNGFEVVSVDNNINSFASVMDDIEKIIGKKIKNYNLDLCDLEATKKIFEDHPDISGVIHFAALKSVGESVTQPLRYFRNNLNSLLNMLECCEQYNVKGFIFSSSCSVYGNAKELPVTEDTPFEEAESPYARTKQIGEKMVKDFVANNPNVNAVMLRYFNPGGAHESTLIGERPKAIALNLVPVITETAIGKRESMVVFGDDYNTRDGSCIRDYIHVMDIANAHTKAIEFLFANKNATNYEVFNLGIGEGVTVIEAIQAFEKISGKKLNYRIAPRREGDVVAIYANNDKALNLLGWNPVRNIEDIMKSAWEWEEKRSEIATN